MRRLLALTSLPALGLASLALAGCSSEAANVITIDEAPLEYVPEGKADDYRSTTGKEYALLARDTIVLEGDELLLEGEARTARVQELVELRFKAISFFAYEYLAGKSRSDANFTYGNFRTTIRQQTFETLAIVERPDAPGTFDFDFEAEAGGPNDLMQKVPISAASTFPLAVPILTRDELESSSYAKTYKAFNAETVAADKLQTLDVAISAKSSEPDAYPNYTAFFEDGVLDVAIHVGGDYNEERYDLVAARDIFDRLQSDLGLTAPVSDFDALRTNSGPFKGTLDANGRRISVEVTLIHPDMNKESGVGYEGLIALYKASAAKADIVMYDGHAGYDVSYSGIVVHYNPRHAIAAADFADLELPAKYQLFVFNGCKTYTSYADAMYKNRAKTVANLDIITTVNFSWLSEMTRVTTDLIGNFTATNKSEHIPRSYDQVLAELNSGRSWDVIYGVHGLSDNARLSPYADTATLCATCNGHAECPGADNLCIKGLGGVAGCAAACTDDTGCPEGYRCGAVAAGGSNLLSGRQCVPTTGRCE